MPAAKMTAEQAARRLLELADFNVEMAFHLLDGDWAYLTNAYRTAARRCHPDAASGSTELFQELEECYRLVKAAVK